MSRTSPSFISSLPRESFAVLSSGLLLPPEPPDQDLDVVAPMDPPVPPVPPDPPPDPNFLVISFSHFSLILLRDAFNLFVSTILKSRTLEAFVVSFDGWSLIKAESSVNPHVPLLTILFVNLAFDVGGNPLRRSVLSYQVVNLVSNVGGNPLRHPVMSYLFPNPASDVGGNPLRRQILNYQKLIRSCCRRTTPASPSLMESISLPYLLSMNGENFSDSFLNFNFSLLTGLLSCGAVCTGPEGTIEITSVFLVGEDCLSTSLVTMSQLSDFVVEALSTHSSLVLNPLSTSYEVLSCLFLIAILVYELSLRGCLIPSWICNPQI